VSIEAFVDGENKRKLPDPFTIIEVSSTGNHQLMKENPIK
jgi:hypothetical protein